MTFLSFNIYIFFFFTRLQDWYAPLVGIPIDYISLSLVFVSQALSGPKRYVEVLKLPQCIFFALFVVVVYLSNIVNGNTSDVTEFGFKYLKYFLTFVAIILAIDSFSKLKWLTLHMIILIIFIAFQCILMWKVGSNWAGATYEDYHWSASHNRVTWVGLFDGANMLALIFVCTIPYLSEYLFVSWGIQYKIFSITAISFVLTGFYLANSRGGFISFLAVVLCIAYTKIKKKKWLPVYFSLVFFIAVFAAPSRMSSINDDQKSTSHRINAWSEALEMVRYNNPLFGVGKGHFTDNTSLIAHNAFLQQLGETGLLGAFCWVGIVCLPLKSIVSISKQDLYPLNRSLYRGCVISLIGLLVGVSFLSSDNEILYIWLGIVSAIPLIEGKVINFTRRDIRLIGGIELAGIVVTYIAVNLFRVIY